MLVTAYPDETHRDVRADHAEGNARGEHDNGVRSVEKALTVLDILAEERTPIPASVSYLVRQTGFHRSSIQRCIASLLGSGYIETDPAGAGYRLAPKVLRLSQRFTRGHNLAVCAHPHLVRLRDKTGETAFLAVPSGDDWMPIAQEESYQTLRQSMSLGATIPLACGAGGRAILAFRSEEFIESILDKPMPACGPGSAKDTDELRERIRIAQRDGCAIGVSELHEGAAGVAGPVFNHEGRVVGSLGIGVPSVRLGANREPELIRELLAACELLSCELGSEIRPLRQRA